jgi:hypothetical protein
MLLTKFNKVLPNLSMGLEFIHLPHIKFIDKMTF